MRAQVKIDRGPRIAPRYHGTRTAAIYLGLSPRTLEKWRLTGQGPPYIKRGRRCLYRLEDLDASGAAGLDVRGPARRPVRARAAPGSPARWSTRARVRSFELLTMCLLAQSADRKCSAGSTA
jgi:Helix-turn-helix domain